MPQVDIILTTLFAIGLVQLCWLSVMAVRRGIPSSLIIRATWSFTGVWVLMWPMYSLGASVWIALVFLGLAILLAASIKRPALEALSLAWSDGANIPWPMMMFAMALAIAAFFFTSLSLPEFGFGAALSLCLGLPLAHWLDRSGRLRLNFPANPHQTLPGHLGLIVTVVIASGWSLHVYHQIGWFESLTATAIAGIAASMMRALIRHPFNLPAITLAIAGVLWTL